MSTATTSQSHQNDTLEMLIGLALLWFVPVVAFVGALFLGWS